MTMVTMMIDDLCLTGVTPAVSARQVTRLSLSEGLVFN